MQIVIDIPEEQYEWIKEHKGVTDFKTTEMLYNAVRNAIVLPKGHGRLIDADYQVSSDGRTVESVCGYIVPSVVEADAEVE